MHHLGPFLRERRRALGLTLAQVADRAQVTRGYVSMIENHKVDNPPSAKVLARLEAALELPPQTLHQSAQWERTPQAIRQRLAQAEDSARAGHELAQWLRQCTAKRPGKAPGKDLDALYRSGQLGRRLNKVLHRDSATPPHADTLTPSPPLAPALQHATPQATATPVPLINKVAAGYPAGFTDLDYPARQGDTLITVPGYTGPHGCDDPDAFAATVCGKSMQPAYREGDVVVFSPLADVVDGCDCFVRLEPDHETTFKRIFIDEATGRLRLQPLNPDFEPRTVDRENVAGMFRAVWRMSRL